MVRVSIEWDNNKMYRLLIEIIIELINRVSSIDN